MNSYNVILACMQLAYPSIYTYIYVNNYTHQSVFGQAIIIPIGYNYYTNYDNFLEPTDMDSAPYSLYNAH